MYFSFEMLELDLFIVDRVGWEDTEQVWLTRAVSLPVHDVTTKRPPDIEIYLDDVGAVSPQLSAR